MAVSESASKQHTSGTRHGDFSLALRCVLVSLQDARLTKKAMRRTGPKSVVCARIQQLGEPGGPSIKLTTDAGPRDDAPPPRRTKNHRANDSPRARTRSIVPAQRGEERTEKQRIPDTKTHKTKQAIQKIKQKPEPPDTKNKNIKNSTER